MKNDAYKSISPKYMLLLFLSTFFVAWIYYVIGKFVNPDPMNLIESVMFTVLLAVVITGSYQIFFWVQNNNYFFKTRCFKIALDDKIPFYPVWIWPYSFFYYIMIGLVLARISSIEEGVELIFGGFLLLFLQSMFFLVLPVTVPHFYREYHVDNLSKKYLRFVQRLDNGRNCFPSMHCSVATYVGLLLVPVLGHYAYLFIGIIAVSCLLVKQHQVLDIIPGILLGWFVYFVNPLIVG
ncbi:MAG: phosphatase PAP2 family protein [Candidatus Marinimicrobia bacterium]|nr:phosphatase PAP2 family protein [Candidatus Neomarinimicrobiota bacterium]